MSNKNKRAKITTWQIVLWPDKDGLLILPTPKDAKAINRPTSQRSARSGLLSPRSRLLRRVQLGKTSPAQSFFSSSLWRSLSSRIGLSFSMVTDHYFVTWMTARLQEAEFGMLTLREVESEARKNLELSSEAVIRLLIKHTSDRGEFRSDGEFISLR